MTYRSLDPMRTYVAAFCAALFLIALSIAFGPRRQPLDLREFR
jgi:hypothetical protein